MTDPPRDVLNCPGSAGPVGGEGGCDEGRLGGRDPGRDEGSELGCDA